MTSRGARRASKPRSKRSLEELRAAKAHVVFELQGLMSAIVGIANVHKQPPDFMSVPLLTARQALIDQHQLSFDRPRAVSRDRDRTACTPTMVRNSAATSAA